MFSSIELRPADHPGITLPSVVAATNGPPLRDGAPAGIKRLVVFGGGYPITVDGATVGAIGVSGDGIDQDDLIAAAGAAGYAPASSIRSDQFFVRSVRLPFVKFPRSPNL